MQYHFERKDSLDGLSEVFMDVYDQIFKKILQEQGDPTELLPVYERILKHAFRSTFITGSAYNLMHLSGLNGIEELDESTRQEEIKHIQIALFIHECMALVKGDVNDKSNGLVVYHYLVERLGIAQEKAEETVLALLNRDKNIFQSHQKLIRFGNEIHVEWSSESYPLDPEVERQRLAVQYGQKVEMKAHAKIYQMGNVELTKNEKISTVTKSLFNEDKTLCLIPALQLHQDPQVAIDNLAQVTFDQVYTSMCENAPCLSYLYQNGQSAKLDRFPEPDQRNDVQDGFFYKTIRADEANFWASFVHSLVDGEPAEMRDTGTRKKWTNRLNENNEYEVIPTYKKHPERKPRWSQEEKALTTRQQSVSYANPRVGYFPEAFGHDKRELLVGIACPPGGVNLISMYDQGTVSRPKDRGSRKDAQDYVESQLHQKVYFKTLPELEEEGVKDQSKHNEILARLKWEEGNEDYKVVVFTDNLESRITAQARAWDMHCAVVDRRQKMGLPITGSYYPKIIFYPSMKEYSEADQRRDLDKPQKDLVLKQMIQIIQAISNGEDLSLDQSLSIIRSQGSNFSKHLTRALVGKHLEEFFNRYRKDKAYYESLFKQIVKSLPLSEIVSVLKDNADPLQKDFIKTFVTNRSEFALLLAMTDPKEWESLIGSEGVAQSLSGYNDLNVFFTVLPPHLWGRLLALKPFSDVNATNALGETNLELAIKAKRLDYADTLLEAGASLPPKQEDRDALLKLAAEYGSVEVAEKCFESGMELSSTFFLALQNGNDHFVEALVEHLKDPDMADGRGRTLLAMSCLLGHESLALKLIEKGASLNKADTDGDTPLYLAMQSRHFELANKLLDLGADPKLCDNNGGSVLHFAAWDAGLSLVKKCVEKGADLNAIRSGMDFGDFDKSTPLHLVLRIRSKAEGGEAIANYFIEAGADINLTNANGDTALSLACHEGYEKLVDKLITLGAAINGKPGQCSALHRAAESGRTEIVKKLLQSGADLNALDANMQSPIMLAVKKKHYKLAAYFLEQGADPVSRDEGGKTLLHRAAEDGNNEFLKLLVSNKGMDLNALDDEGNTALHLAITYRHFDLAKELINQGASLTLYNKKGYSALYVASGKGNLSLIQLLLEKGAPVLSEDSAHKSPFAEACANGYLSAAKLLLEYGANINVVEVHTGWGSRTSGQTPLLTSLAFGHPAIARFLMEQGAKVDIVDSEGMTALHYASQEGYEDIAENLIRKGLDMNLLNKEGYTPFHLACKAGADKLVDLYIQKQAKLNLLTNDGKSLFYLALQFGHKKIAEDLIKAGVSPIDLTKQGESPLHMACGRGWDDLAEKIIAAGADPNQEATDYMQTTPMMQAILSEQYDLALSLCHKHPEVLSAFLNPKLYENTFYPYHTVQFWGRISEALDPKNVFKVINNAEKFDLARRLILPEDFEKLFNGFTGQELQSLVKDIKDFQKLYGNLSQGLRSIYIAKVGDIYLKQMVPDQDSFLSLIYKKDLTFILELVDVFGDSYLTSIITNLYSLCARLPGSSHLAFFQKLGPESSRKIITSTYDLKSVLNELPMPEKIIFLNLLGVDFVRGLLKDHYWLSRLTNESSEDEIRFLWNFLGAEALRETLDSSSHFFSYVEKLTPGSRETLLDILGDEYLVSVIRTKEDRKQFTQVFGDAVKAKIDTLFNDSYFKSVVNNVPALSRELRGAEAEEQMNLLQLLGADSVSGLLGKDYFNYIFSDIQKELVPKFLAFLGVEYLSSLPHAYFEITNGSELGLILREFPKDSIKQFVNLLQYQGMQKCMPDVKHLFVALSKIKPENRTELLEGLEAQKASYLETSSLERIMSEAPNDLRAMIIDLIPENAQSEWARKFKLESDDGGKGPQSKNK